MLPLEHRESHSPNGRVAHLGATRVLGPARREHAACQQVAEPGHEDRVGLQGVERGRLVGGQRPDAAAAGCLRVEVRRVVRGGLGQRAPAGEPVQAREDQAAEREVRVAARVAGLQLGVRARVLAPAARPPGCRSPTRPWRRPRRWAAAGRRTGRTGRSARPARAGGRARPRGTPEPWRRARTGRRPGSSRCGRRPTRRSAGGSRCRRGRRRASARTTRAGRAGSRRRRARCRAAAAGGRRRRARPPG
jgi:hypothetical protein